MPILIANGGGVNLPWTCRPSPYPDFPLVRPSAGRLKQIHGKIHFSGKWGHVVNGKLERLQEKGCWQQAIERYEKQRDALTAWPHTTYRA